MVNQPLARLFDRPRPYAVHPGEAHLLIAPSSDPSFPSDHATVAVAIATAVWGYDRLAGAILLALAALVALSRVVAGTHYPSDVMGGAVVGLLMTLVLLLIGPVRRRLERFADGLSAVWDRFLSRLIQGQNERAVR